MPLVLTEEQSMLRFTCHSGEPRSGEPGIHNHDREYGFRACAKGRIPE